MPKMDETQLKSILSSEINSALGIDGGTLSHERRRLLERYEGRPFGTELPNRSHAVARNVLEVVETVMPQIMAVFATKGDVIFEFEPLRPGEEPAAAQATQYINYIFCKDNPGFEILYTWFKDSLIQKVGYVICHWVEERTFSVSSYTGLNDLEYQQLVQSADVEIIEETAYTNPDSTLQWFTEDSPQPTAPTLHDVKLRIFETQGRVKVENVAPEQILVSRRADNTVLDGKHFVCRRVLKRKFELTELGYPQDLIDEVVGSSETDWNTERMARYLPDDDFPFAADRADPAMQEVWLAEVYIRVDYDGDNVAELRRIVCSENGTVIFENEEIDEIPIIAICPLPLPHRHIGLALSDLVVDLEEIKSFIIRQTLDSLYLSTTPRMLVDETAAGDSTYEDLLNVRPGGIVRVSNIQGIQPLEIPFVGQTSLPVIQYLDQAQEVRTGVSRANLGLSPDMLNNTTATAASLQQNNAMARVELICRIFAEQGVKVLAQRILGLVIKHQQEARIIRLTGNWVPIDPRDWKENMDITVNVGLGTGNKDQQLMHISTIMQVQQQMVAHGGLDKTVSIQNIYNAANRLTQNAGFKNDEFFTDPSRQPPQPPGAQPPNPEMVKVQADAAINQAKLQADIEQQKVKAQFEMQLEQQRYAHKQQLEDADAQHQFQLEQQREQFKARLEMTRLAQQAQREARQDQPAPPVPGARRAPDGNHYIADPGRPGKYMMLV